MNPTTSTINPSKKVYDINGTKVRAISEDVANALASEIQSETVVPTAPAPKPQKVRAVREESSMIQEPSTPQVKSVESIQGEMLRNAQGELSYLDNYYKQQLEEQNKINQKNDRSNQAISTLTGLAGSTEADFQQQKVTSAGNKATQSILNEAKAAAQTVYGRISQAAISEARAQRLEARQTEQERIANRAARQQQAISEIQNISASGITLDGLKSSDKTTYDYMVRQFGSEDALKGAYVLNTPQEQILDKRVENGKYIIARQNPITGKTTIESIDLGIPEGYSKTLDAGDRILAIPDNWDGDTSKLVTINKGLTPKDSSSIGTGVTDPIVSSWVNLIRSGGAKITSVPAQYKNAVTQALASNQAEDPSVARAKDALAVIEVLENSAGRGGAIGFGFQKMIPGLDGPIPGTAASDYLAQVDRLKAILSLDNLKALRGLGAMSDREFATIQSSVGALSPSMSEAAFKKELERIKESLQSTQNITPSNDVTDPYAQFRSQLQEGEVMVVRDGNVTAITQAELLPTDQQI